MNHSSADREAQRHWKPISTLDWWFTTLHSLPRSLTPGEPRSAKTLKPGHSSQPGVPALAPPGQAPRPPGQQSCQGEHGSLDLGSCVTGLILISLGPTLQSRASSLWATDPCAPTKHSRKVKLSPSSASSYRSLLKIPAPETQNQTDNPHSLLK